MATVNSETPELLLVLRKQAVIVLGFQLGGRKGHGSVTTLDKNRGVMGVCMTESPVS
jgi:hypothetical protein